MKALKVYIQEDLMEGTKLALKKDEDYETYSGGTMADLSAPVRESVLPFEFEFLKDLSVGEYDPKKPGYPVLVTSYDESDLTDSKMCQGGYDDYIESPFYQNIYSRPDMMWPIVHVFANDYLNPDEDKNKDKNRIRIPRFFKIVDSSIWNHYHFDNSGKVMSGAAERLQKVFDLILKNYRNSKYEFQISHEYANFNYRLVRESYLVGAHASDVSPFLFHSESGMQSKDKMRESQEKLFSEGRSKYKWRFLLVDDCAEKRSLAKHGDNTESRDHQVDLDCPNPYGKLNIVKTLFEECGFEVSWDVLDGTSNTLLGEKSYKDVHISCVHTVDDALDALDIAAERSVRYDIILLDYLLASTDSSIKSRYSYEILNSIEAREDLKNTAGPNKRYYFMYMSAFTTAIQERMMERGFSRSEPFWYIGQGACPTNTPEKFKFYLMSLMKKRVDDVQGDFKYGCSLVEYLETVFAGDGNVRDMVYRSFDSFLDYRARYRVLRRDHGKSRLVDSLYPDLASYDTHFWDHLQQMLYMIAYGTVRQWPQMWEEYIFIKDTLEKVSQGHTVDLCRNIEQYIIGLKGGKK